MKFQLSGPAGRASKTLSVAASLILIVSTASLPALAARHHHTHLSSRFNHHVHNAHRAHFERAAESSTHHQARLARLQAEHEARASRQQQHNSKVQQETKALHSGNVVVAARAFEGTRYIFGGTSRSGFDCSGFTRYILGQSAGVDLPRTAMEQYYNGQSIDKTSLQPGDLVFFQNTYRHGISHVGIYIGNNNFVHACNSTRGVTIDSLDEAYYVNHYAGARRVIANREEAER